MGIFYKQMHYWGANTCAIPAKQQVKSWQLVKLSSAATGPKKLVSVIPPEELWIFYHPSQGEGKPSCVSEGQSLSATCP